MKDLSEEPEEESSIWDGPLKYIVALFLLFLLVLWIVPAYTVRFNPAPRYIAMPEEVIPTFELGNETGNEVYRREEFPGMIAGNTRHARRAPCFTLYGIGSRMCQIHMRMNM